MRKAMIIAVTAACVAGATLSLTAVADAQGAPPAPPPAQPYAMDHGPQGGPMDHPGMMEHGMMEHGGWHHRMGMMQHMRQFALIYPAKDRNLSGPDVQKIAEAFLLLNGNHTWKITDVQEQPDQVTFAVATPDGTAIAHFAMNRHTARPHRID